MGLNRREKAPGEGVYKDFLTMSDKGWNADGKLEIHGGKSRGTKKSPGNGLSYQDVENKDWE